MTIRTKILSWRNINSDTDFSKFIETVSEAWVIEWFQVSTNKISAWKAWLPYERTTWETVYALIENFDDLTIDTSWTWYVILYIDKNNTEDWTIISEDWTNVAEAEVVEELPAKNYLLIASLSSGVITDERNMIKKIWELDTSIQSIEWRVADLWERIEVLENSQSIPKLIERWLVWELYTSSSNMIRQFAPTGWNSIVEDCKVWYDSASTEIHIQRIASWTESNKLKLKIRAIWSPTTALYVEVRKWIQVNVSSTEAYWYWDSSQIIASWSLASSNFSSSFAEKEFTLNNNISVDRWTLLDIVVYQEWKAVSSSAYYIVGCDKTQWSEAFSFVKVNWTTRSRSKLCPFCDSNSFEKQLYSKYSTATVSWWLAVSHYQAMGDWDWTSAVRDSTPWRWYVYSNNNPQTAQNFTIANPLIQFRVRIANAWLLVKKNDTTIHWSTPRWWARDTWYLNWWLSTNTKITVQACDWSYWGSYFLSRVDYDTMDTISIWWKNLHKMTPAEVKWLWLEAQMDSFWRIWMNRFTGK